MYKEIPEKFLDTRNHPIWNEIKYNLEFKAHEGRHCYYNIYYDTANIFIPVANFTKEAFTHEMLHVLLHQEKIRIGEHLVQRFKTQPLLNWSLSGNLFSRVGHYLEDYKILPIYLMAGFDRTLFIEDYHIPRCSAVNMETIRSGLSKQVPSIYSVDLFIGKFFAMKTSPSDQVDYQKYYDQLQCINTPLFDILETFWKKWEMFDIYTFEHDPQVYKSFSDTLIEQLGEWTVRTIHTKNESPIRAEVKIRSELRNAG